MSERNLQNRRCAVLGAGGFIGSNLCRRLKEEAGAVRAFGRRMTFPEALAGIDWLQGDFLDPTSHANAIAGCDTVIHLVSATNPASGNLNIAADVEANVVSSLHLFEACRFFGVRRVVFLSSGGTVYGAPIVIPTPETHPLEPITAYGVSKLSIERYLALYSHLYGLDYRILRAGNAYGPYQTAAKGQGVVAAFIERALEGAAIDIWGDGEVVRDYFYVGDLVEAILLAIAHDGPSRVFNIGSGEGASVNEIAALVEAATGRPLEKRRLEARPIDAPKSILDISLAKKELGWAPRVPLREGIARTVAWRRGQNDPAMAAGSDR